MGSARPWVKVWESWFKSRSHDDLDAPALLVGLRLLCVAQAAPVEDEEDETRWCLSLSGEPKSIASLARECRLSSRQTQRAISSLLAVGTIVRREDGAVGFPRWNTYQLSPSALRMRRHRERHRGRHEGGVTVTPDVDAKRTEDRRQKKKPPNPRTRGRSSREANPELVEAANAVIDRLNERRAWIAERFKLAGVQLFRHAKGNRLEILRVLDEGEPLERLLAVVDAAAREVAQKRGEGLQWLTPVTPFRAKNWPRYVGKIGAPETKNETQILEQISITEAVEHEARFGCLPPGWQREPAGIVGPNGALYDVGADA